MSYNYATALHNYFQGRHESTRLTYAETPSGPSNAQVWTTECKIDGKVKGTGKGPNKIDAKQAAAREAWLDLNPYGDAK
ncbi:hypothetical protein D9619_002734 [Psilocybe cf. subviscida]|uniref:DRBM domain-containing protein n=1 Tax=Psilocybe cf. subviscida TaxID=2480587 RepID=A0A8H5EUU7_9AGAR|nr:hypothetical protein D9619_002734 [Psilocybe cf. subviscida]